MSPPKPPARGGSKGQAPAPPPKGKPSSSPAAKAAKAPPARAASSSPRSPPAQARAEGPRGAARPAESPASRTGLSPKLQELGRNFIAALFMGVRTAQIHEPQNKAFERAVHALRGASEQLFAATSGFVVSFVGDSAFLNGARLRFDGSMYDSVRSLRHMLESKELGGIEMRSIPPFEAIRKLLLLFSASTQMEVSRDDLLAAQIGMLGVQRFADQSRDGLKVDRRIFAVQSYAKLLLAFREQRASGDSRAAPRLRAIRVVQDLVELCGDRSDFLLRLGSNHEGAPVDELHAVNVAVLSIALAHALGLGRQALVDIGIAALFHDVGRTTANEPMPAPAAGDRGSTGDVADPISDAALQGGKPRPARAAASLPEDGDTQNLPMEEYLGELEPVDPSETPREHAAATAETLDAAEEEVDALHRLSMRSYGEVSDETIDTDGKGKEAPMVLPVQHGGEQSTYDMPPEGDEGPRRIPTGQPGHIEEAWQGGEHGHTAASLARMLAAGGMQMSGMLRAIVAAEHHARTGERYAWGEIKPQPHLYSRIVAVVDAYDALTSGLGSEDGGPVHPLEALERLRADRSGRVDPRIVDLLINVLRAFPVGTEVVLDSGEHAIVASHAGGTRWDRPVIRTLTEPVRSLDLMLQDGGRFRARIVGTARAVGADS